MQWIFHGSLRRAASEVDGAVGSAVGSAVGCPLSFAKTRESRQRDARKRTAVGAQVDTWNASRGGVLCAMTCVGVSIAGAASATPSAMLHGTTPATTQFGSHVMLSHGSSVRRSVGMDAALRVRLTELTSQAVEALRIASWADGVAPTIEAPLDLVRSELLVALANDVPRPPRGAWAVLRAGREPIGGVPPSSNRGDDDTQRIERSGKAAPALRSASLSRDDDLDRACALLVKHALMHALARTIAAQAEDGLGPAGPLPADIVRRIVEALPLPPNHPGSDPARHRLLKRLERQRVGTRLPKSIEVEVREAEADFREAHAVARAWLARLDVVHGMLARMADVEGVAVVRVSRAIRLASAGWDPETASTMDARPLSDDGATPLTGTERPIDRVLADIRAARNRGFACGALAESLQAARVVDVEVMESVAADGDGTLQLGRRRVRVTGERLDDWRRACGVRPNPTQSPPPARGSSPSRRIRDAPFGIKPL